MAELTGEDAFNDFDPIEHVTVLRKEQATAPLPDVAGYADLEFVHGDDPGLTLLHPLASVCSLEYPDGTKRRRMAFLEGRDLARTRALAAVVLSHTDLLLDPGVCSARPEPGIRPFVFRNEWDRLIRIAFDAARGGEALVTDVTDYFGSVQPSVVRTCLERAYVPTDAIDAVLATLDECHATGAVRGLPIGPDLSRVIGTALLRPLDQVASRRRTPYGRFTDDIVVGVCGEADANAVIAEFDESLDALRLTRSVKKTDRLDRAGVRAKFTRHRLSDLRASPRDRDDSNRKRITRLFREMLDSETSAKELRFVLQRLRGTEARAAAVQLARRFDLATLDLGSASRFMAAVSASDPIADMNDALLETFADAAGPDADAVRIHTLRALEHANLGSAEAKAFEKIAEDVERHPLLRAWCWRRLAGSTAFNPGAALEVVRFEGDRIVRRGAVAALRRSGGRDAEGAAELLAEQWPGDPHTERWLRAA